MLVLTKITYYNIHTQQITLRKLMGLKNSIHGSHVAHGPIVGPY